MAPLNNNQWEKFCLAYVKGKTQAQAAIDAGYSPKTAYSIGNRLLKKVEISGRIKQLQRKAVSNTIMSVKERKERLSEIARARLTDFVAAGENGARINVTLESAHSAALQEVTTEVVKIGGKDSDTEAHITKLKLRDPIAAIAELNKMEGEYKPQKVDVTSKGNEIKPTVVNVVSPEAAKMVEEITSGEGTE